MNEQRATTSDEAMRLLRHIISNDLVPANRPKAPNDWCRVCMDWGGENEISGSEDSILSKYIAQLSWRIVLRPLYRQRPIRAEQQPNAI